MFCRKCGKAILDDSEFCSYCGEPVESETKQSVQPIADENETKQLTIESYPYGSCGRCAEPLEKDDNFVCKKCLAKDNDPAGFYVQEFHEPLQPNYGSKVSGHKSRHGVLVAIVLIAIIALGVKVMSGNSSPAVKADAVVASSEATIVSSEVVQPAASAAPTNSPDMSLSEYYKIKNGMTYDQVTEIIGSYGEEQARSGSGEYETIIISCGLCCQPRVFPNMSRITTAII